MVGTNLISKETILANYWLVTFLEMRGFETLHLGNYIWKIEDGRTY